MTSLSGKLIKFILILFNLALLILGIFLIYTGYVIFQENDHSEAWQAVMETNFKTGSIIFMIFGAMVIIISLLGCMGACLESPTMLDIYGYIIFIVVIAEIILFYYSFKYKNEFIHDMQVGVKNAMNQYTKDSKLAYGLQWIQHWLECCGLESPDDYNSTNVPASCCDQMDKVTLDQPRGSCSKSEIKFKKGCKESPFVTKTLGSVTMIAYILVIVQLIVILAACCLSRDVQSSVAP